ncbi:hypothetical protein HDE_10967 [Halotydeus destructor]|nr:hypothetical protein HDE_10967 [Halotydeus destructor]
MVNLTVLLSLFALSLVGPSWAGQYFARPDYKPQHVINSLLNNMGPLIPRTECYTSADNRAGVCMSKAACVTSGGVVAGSCGLLSSCCIYQGSCRAVVNANETYFVSPQYPNLQSERLDPPVCIFTLKRNNLVQKWPICQIRLDFDEFSLAAPWNGTCGGLTDSFVISGATNFNASGLPEHGICGDLSGQHLYVNVDPDDTSEPLLLVVNTANEQRFTRKWSIRIRQVPCHSPFKAPPGCLQYHTTNTGIVESFNYRGLNTGRPNYSPTGYQQQELLPNPNYFNEMNYGICVAQQPKTCGVKWEAIEFDMGGGRESVSGTGAPGTTNIGCTQSTNLGGSATPDIGDYVLIPGASADGVSLLEHTFCGQFLNPRPDMTLNSALTSFFKPFVMYVKTDNSGRNALGGAQNQKGFQLRYNVIECS